MPAKDFEGLTGPEYNAGIERGTVLHDPRPRAGDRLVKA